MSLKSIETLFFVICPIHDFIFQFPKLVPLELLRVNNRINFLVWFPKWWVIVASVHCLKALRRAKEVRLFVWSLSWRNRHYLYSVLYLLEFFESILCGIRLNNATSIGCINQEVHQGPIHDLLLFAGCETLKLLITTLTKNWLAFKNLLQAGRWDSVLLSKGLKWAWLFALTWSGIESHGLELLDFGFIGLLGVSFLLRTLEDLADLLGAHLLGSQHWEINVQQFCDSLGWDSLMDGPKVLGHRDHLVPLGRRQLLVEDLGVDVTLHQEGG